MMMKLRSSPRADSADTRHPAEAGCRTAARTAPQSADNEVEASEIPAFRQPTPSQKWLPDRGPQPESADDDDEPW